jgi:hypothetical protein
MAVVVLGGLLTSLALNMVVVPVLFVRYGVTGGHTSRREASSTAEPLEPVIAGASP